MQYKRTIECGDQNYSASEWYSTVINTAVQVNLIVRWSTLQFNWNVQCGEQISMSCDERYSAVSNTTLQVIYSMRWSTL
jgi:hypothetical protein